MRRLAPACCIGLLAAVLSASSLLSQEPQKATIEAQTVLLVPAESQPGKVTGRIVTRDQEGGLLLEDSSGVYWTLEAKVITARQPAGHAYQRAEADELAESLRSAAGGNVLVVKTKHYVIASRASRAYATWCGALLERLRTGFLGHWERVKLPLTPNDSPLPILILQNKTQFTEYAVRDGAAAAAETFGYYSARTNRVVLFDLTADQPGEPLGEAAGRDEITRRLSRTPASVATVVHEAVHQLAFNTGLQVRYADNPMWLTEGLAMYFETPDFGTGTRWTGAGKTNPWRLQEFQRSLPMRAEDSLSTLAQNEDRFHEPATMTSAYAESWVLVHYLSTKRREQWLEYLKTMRDKAPLVFETPEERLAAFRKAFGDDLSDLDKAVITHARELGQRRSIP